MLDTGTEIGGIRLERLLGRGAMGEVYRGLQLSLKRPVAVKRIADHLVDEPEAVLRFEREAQVVARLQSPHVVQVFDFVRAAGPDGKTHCLIVMELIEGGMSLRDALRGHGALPWQQAASLALQAAEGLAAAAEFGVIHRDVKPDNIMLTRKGVAKLADFGLARAMDSSAMTQEGALLGTPNYIAPEGCRGEAVDHRADLYSLGATWYHLATGEPPFRGDNLMALLRHHLETPAPDVRELASDTPAPIAELIAACLAKVPEARPASAQVLAERLQALAAEGLMVPRSVPDLVAAVGDGEPDPAGEGSTARTELAGDDAPGGDAPTVMAATAATTPDDGRATAATAVPGRSPAGSADATAATAVAGHEATMTAVAAEHPGTGTAAADDPVLTAAAASEPETSLSPRPAATPSAPPVRRPLWRSLLLVVALVVGAGIGAGLLLMPEDDDASNVTSGADTESAPGPTGDQAAEPGEQAAESGDQAADPGEQTGPSPIEAPADAAPARDPVLVDAKPIEAADTEDADDPILLAQGPQPQEPEAAPAAPPEPAAPATFSPATSPAEPTAPSKPAPEPSKPAPEPSKPAPEPSKPTPAPSDPAPEPSEPAPQPSDPAPAPSDPTPAPSDPTPAPSDPTPAPSDPTPAPSDPTPAPSDPTPAPSDPAPASSDPAPAPAEDPDRATLTSIHQAIEGGELDEAALWLAELPAEHPERAPLERAIDDRSLRGDRLRLSAQHALDQDQWGRAERLLALVRRHEPALLLGDLATAKAAIKQAEVKQGRALDAVAQHIASGDWLAARTALEAVPGELETATLATRQRRAELATKLSTAAGAALDQLLAAADAAIAAGDTERARELLDQAKTPALVTGRLGELRTRR